MTRSARDANWVLPTLAITLFAGAVSPAAGQLVDRGEFHLSLNGEPVGKEEFTIQRSGSGPAQITLAKGTVTLDAGGTITTQLQVRGPSFAVFRYSVSVTGDDAKTVNVARIGDRLQARTVAPWGEELREYRATESTLLLDRGVAHHYFLLAPLLDELPNSVHTVSPLSEGEESLSGLTTGSDLREVEGEPVEVRRLQFTSPGGDREVWFDTSGRVVRVSDSATGLIAERVPTS